MAKHRNTYSTVRSGSSCLLKTVVSNRIRLLWSTVVAGRSTGAWSVLEVLLLVGSLVHLDNVVQRHIDFIGHFEFGWFGWLT